MHLHYHENLKSYICRGMLAGTLFVVVITLHMSEWFPEIYQWEGNSAVGKVNQYFYSAQLLNVMIPPPYRTGSSQLATIWQWWGPWLNIHATLGTTNLLAPTRLCAFPVENMMKIHLYVKVCMISFGTKLSPKLELTCSWGWYNTSMYGQMCFFFLISFH